MKKAGGLTIEEQHSAHGPASTLRQQILRGRRTVAQHAEGFVAVR